MYTSTATEMISAPPTGSSHQTNAGLSQYTSATQASPSSACVPCWRSATDHGVCASSRGGDCQLLERPSSVPTTKRVWNSIRIGASTAENTVSAAALAFRRSAPP